MKGKLKQKFVVTFSKKLIKNYIQSSWLFHMMSQLAHRCPSVKR